MLCSNCKELIEPSYSKYNLGWRHSNTGDVFCRNRMAQPAPCVCNVGVQECAIHPGRLRTQEEKIAFRKRWDARVAEGKR